MSDLKAANEEVPYHLAPDNGLFVESNPARPSQVSFTTNRQFPPVLGNLLRDTAGFVELLWAQAKGHAFANSLLGI